MGDRRFDYDEYTRYINNLNYMYLRVNRKAEVTATIHDMGKGNRNHTLSVYVGGIGTILSEEEQRVLRQISHYCSTENKQAWIIMDFTLNVVYRSKVIPMNWIASVLPLVKAKNEYILDGFLYWISPSSCRDTCIPCTMTEEHSATTRYFELLDLLLKLYERGSIAHCTEEFARDWQLEKDEFGIFYPTWWNVLLTNGDPTLYLQNVGEGTSYERESALAYALL